MPKVILVPSYDWRTTPLRHLASQSFRHRLMLAMIGVIALIAVLVMPVGSASAQQAPLHLNPAVEKLARGEPIIGTQTDDRSLQNCHPLARLNFYYSYVYLQPC